MVSVGNESRDESRLHARRILHAFDQDESGKVSSPEVLSMPSIKHLGAPKLNANQLIRLQVTFDEMVAVLDSINAGMFSNALKRINYSPPP